MSLINDMLKDIDKTSKQERTPQDGLSILGAKKQRTSKDWMKPASAAGLILLFLIPVYSIFTRTLVPMNEQKASHDTYYENLLYAQDLLIISFLVLSVIGLGMLWILIKR